MKPRKPRQGALPPAPAAVVIADARCLQDPDYAPRGVGRHALALVADFPRGPRAKLVALVDPLLPPMADHAAALFDAVATNPHGAQHHADRLGTLSAYTVLSPMTHDPLYGARFLEDPSIWKSAVVYDFIPLRHPERYLNNPAADLGYALRLFWLAKNDCFVPISQSAADDLVEHLGIRHGNIRVSGAPLTEGHAKDRGAWVGAQRQGVLVVGGGDPRKSPETVIQAHARSPALQQTRTELTVAGNYGPDQRLAFKALAQAEGGDPALVQIPGHISEAELVALYRSAATVVCASVDEGFSLPVIEGMAAGAVVLASDIPAHRELVPNATHLFTVGDVQQLAQLLDHVGSEERGATVAAQDQVWPRFHASRVAERFWSLAMPTVPLPTPALLRARPRVALLSPLPPDQTGVGDYTHATCLEIGKRVDLHVFTNTDRPGPVPGAAAVLPLSDLPGLSPAYQRSVSVIGNSHFHGAMLEHLERYGGAAIAHDARMLHFYYALRGGEAAAEIASRELGRPVPILEVEGWLHNERTMQTLFLSAIAAAASPMIVHSPVTKAMLSTQLGIETVHVPFCIYHPFEAAELSKSRRKAARAKLGIAPNEVVLATFGFVDAVKAPEDCLWALEELRRWGLNATLHFVGQYIEDASLPSSLVNLAARLGVAESVRFFPAYLGAEVYRDYLLAADVAIQLRTYGLGGLSGALLDCAGAGLPCVTNQSLFDAVMPPPAYTEAIPNVLSPVLLAEAVAKLAGVRASRTTEAARLAFCEDRSLSRYADGLIAALGLQS